MVAWWDSLPFCLGTTMLSIPWTTLAQGDAEAMGAKASATAKSWDLILLTGGEDAERGY